MRATGHGRGGAISGSPRRALGTRAGHWMRPAPWPVAPGPGRPGLQGVTVRAAVAAYVPPGWPSGVHPPGSEDFEATAVGWLLDVVPPDYRLYGVLRRYPIALATLAKYHVTACVHGARQGYRSARAELGGVLPPHALAEVLAAYGSEGRRLAEAEQAVGLVLRALRGEVFAPKLRDESQR